MTMASFVAMIASIIMQSFFFSALFGGNNRNNGAGWIIVWIASIIVYALSTLLILALSRYREYAADRGSALITRNPQALISAEVDQWQDGSCPPQAKAKVESANAFFIIPALTGNTIMELFSTHPPMEKRIAALERIAVDSRNLIPLFFFSPAFLMDACDPFLATCAGRRMDFFYAEEASLNTPPRQNCRAQCIDGLEVWL